MAAGGGSGNETSLAQIAISSHLSLVTIDQSKIVDQNFGQLFLINDVTVR